MARKKCDLFLQLIIAQWAELNERGNGARGIRRDQIVEHISISR